MLIGVDLYKVKDKHGKSHFFDLKSAAKKFRDNLDFCTKGAVVSPGPSHPDHHTNRSKIGWNKGRHPKKNHKGSKLIRK